MCSSDINLKAVNRFYTLTKGEVNLLATLTLTLQPSNMGDVTFVLRRAEE